MVRTILYVIVAVLFISALRSVIGIFARAFGSFVNPQPQAARKPSVEAGGELKRDPVCGTFISTSTALQKKLGGETYYFCSPSCREKFSLQKSGVRSQKPE
jgi:YHS domain-containing protein